MDSKGYIDIHIVGRKGNDKLTPDNFDIKEIVDLLSNVEVLLYPVKKNRPLITYSINSGSVLNRFGVSKQAEYTFVALASLIAASGNIDSLELSAAKSIEQMQDWSRKNNYSFEFYTSENTDKSLLTITPQTSFYRTEKLWVEAEFYFYGTLVDAGGKDNPNIHLETKSEGTLVISTEKEILKNREDNLLYKNIGVRVLGRQNVSSGEFDKSNLKLIELIDYSSVFNEMYLNKLIAQAGKTWSGIDADEFISELRGYDE